MQRCERSQLLNCSNCQHLPELCNTGRTRPHLMTTNLMSRQSCGGRNSDVTGQVAIILTMVIIKAKLRTQIPTSTWLEMARKYRSRGFILQRHNTRHGYAIVDCQPTGVSNLTMSCLTFVSSNLLYLSIFFLDNELRINELRVRNTYVIIWLFICIPIDLSINTPIYLSIVFNSV